MKTKILLSISLLLTTLSFSNFAFATIKVVPDKPVEPDFVCKTEVDIPSARARAITSGGGPDFAGSAEALCRSQIEANKPSTITNNYNYNYTLPSVSNAPKIDMNVYMQGWCSIHVEGSKYKFNESTQKPSCECPANSVQQIVSDDGKDNLFTKCVDINTALSFIKVASSTATSSTVAPKQIDISIATSTATSTHKYISKSLKIGSRGSDVSLLQSMLGIEQTGYYGSKTREAVVKFQKSKNLPQTGIVSDLTRKVLNK